MRKTLSIVLSVMLILSACCFAIPVSAAPEGTAINTADEFMAMAADGTYYLNADITLTGTYATPFTGTFDGNGKTVTISAPMFAEFNGTVKNLTMNGSISSAENAAAFALLSNEGMIAENVTSNVSITIMGEGRYGASIICENYGTNMVSEYTNCVNNGDIYIDTTAAEKSRVGGIGAIVENAVFTKCVNNGDITTIGNIGMAAGICARAALHAGVNTAEAYYCVNNGDITATDNYATTGGSDAAGIFAYIGCASNMGFYTVYGCLNTGDISAPYRAAGMVSYTYGSGATAFIDIEFCVSTGNITYGRTATSAASAADYGSYFVGYTNSPSTVIKYNIGTGTIKKVDGSISTNPTCLIGCSSADPTLYDVTDNYIIDNGAYTNFSYSGKEGYESFIMDMSYGIENGAIIRTTEADLASGKVTVAINNAAQGGYTGEYFFYQTIGTDAIPTVDSSSGWVLENNGTYVNGEKPVAPVVTTTEKQEDPTTTPVEEDPTTTPVEEDPTTTPAEVEPTTTPADNTPTTTPGGSADTEPTQGGGCGGFVALGVIACVIPAAVVVCSKKKED